jgi:hypothetical protein
VDTLNIALAGLALITVGVAIFITRNHRHDLISLGVPLLGIVFSVIPLVRVLRHANTVPGQIAARLSAVPDGEAGDIAPCSDDPAERQLRTTVAVLKKELSATQPLQFFFTHLMSFLIGVCSSLVASYLNLVQRPT